MNTNLRDVKESLKNCFGDDKLYNAYRRAFEQSSVAQTPYVRKVNGVTNVGINSFSIYDVSKVIDFTFDLETPYPRIDVFSAKDSIYTPATEIYRPHRNKFVSITCLKSIKAESNLKSKYDINVEQSFNSELAGTTKYIVDIIRANILLYNS